MNRLTRAPLLTLAVLLLAGLLPAGGAVAAPTSHRAAGAACQSVHIGPQQPAKTRLNYFVLHVAPGQRVTTRLIVANPDERPCTVALSTAAGRTALNSGNTYVATAGPSGCRLAGCWLSRLPETVTVSPHGRRHVAFVVTAPSTARPGQYLAGVIGAPDGKGGKRSPQHLDVRVVTRVAIGVAVIVDGQLRPHLRIPDVTVAKSADSLGSVLSIHEKDDGNTWEHPTGIATVQASKKRYSFPVRSNTILAGNVATLQASAVSVPQGTHPTRVVLWYAGHTKKAVWDGRLVFGVPAQVSRSGNRIIVTRQPGQPPARVPAWVLWLLGIVAVLLVLLLGVIFLLLWRRRRDEEGDEPDVDIEADEAARLSELR